MNHWRSGACGLSADDLDDSHARVVDPIEAGTRSRESAAAYAAWINAGKTREQITAERHQRAAEVRERRGERHTDRSGGA